MRSRLEAILPAAMGRVKTNDNQPATGGEPAGSRGGAQPAPYPPTGDDDAEYPQTVVFPPPPPAGHDPMKRSSAAADKPGRRGRQADEYPETVMFPPRKPGQAGAGSVDEYPETIMFPPRAPGQAGGGSVDEYPETIMFPPRAPGQPGGGSVDEYPETVMFPPRAPGQPGGGSVDEYPETVMFPPRAPGQPGGGSVDEYPPTVAFPPPAPRQPGGAAGDYPARVGFNPPRPQRHSAPTRPPGVVHPQPRPHPPSQVFIGNAWSTGLFDCDQDSTNTVMTAFFPCVTFGQIADILDQGQTSCTLGSFMYALLMPILSCALVGTTYRTRLRQMYNLVEAPGEDWSLHVFCPCCALCQEYRELQHRGYDPSIGWAGNIAVQQATTPPRMTPMHN